MTEHTRLRSSRRTMAAIALLLIAAISVFIVSEAVSAPAFNASTIASLDEKKDTVMKLAVAAAASSTVITLIPGDTAMPIADEIAELSSYFILILSAILLGKDAGDGSGVCVVYLYHSLCLPLRRGLLVSSEGLFTKHCNQAGDIWCHLVLSNSC